MNCLDFGELSRVATIIQSLRDGSLTGPFQAIQLPRDSYLPSFYPSGTKSHKPLTRLKPPPNPLEGRSLVDTKDPLDILPGCLPFTIVHVNVGLAAARQVALKGVRFCSEQVIGIDDFGHKGNILALDSP